jgi:Leucine-rich repeat (LRR) protein
MKLKIVVIVVATLLAVSILGTGMAFGSNKHFLRSNDVVSFNDANLEIAVRANLAMQAGVIRASDMEGIKIFCAYDLAINDLTGLEYCVNMEGLMLVDCGVDDLSPILNLPKLQCIFANGNRLTAVPCLDGLPALDGLVLNDNFITDISALAGKEQFRSVFLRDNRVADLTPLAGLIGLTDLDISNNRVTDISALAGLTALTSLTADNNTITDVTPLAGLTALVQLSLRDNFISDVAPLAGLQKLESLYLNNNRIVDVAPLAGNIDPLNLGLDGNLITDISPLVIPKVWDPHKAYIYYLLRNPLDDYSLNTCIPRLNSYGVQVYY